MCTALLCFSVTAAEYMPNFKDTDINEFINIVGKNLERTIIVDPNVRGKISVRSYDMLNEDQYYQFFLNVLQVYDFAVVEMPSGILKVVRSKDAKTSNIPVVEGAKRDGDEYITRVGPVYDRPVPGLAPILRLGKGEIFPQFSEIRFSNSFLWSLDTCDNIQNLISRV